MGSTVLVCDSDDEVAYLQYHLLRAAPDLVVDVTSDPFQAVETAARARPDVVTVDLGLEGLGGVELIRRLCASTPGTRVIARSSSRDVTVVAEALGAGAAGYVLRDDGPDALLAAIRAALTGAVVLSPVVATGFGSEVARTVAGERAIRAELEELRASVNQGTSAKADFLANISHELRTPVTVAKGIAYVLRNPAVPPQERDQFLGQLQSSLDKLMGIVDEIITIAELERGTFELEVAPMDLAPLIRHAVDEVAREYPGTPIDAQVPDELRAVADGTRIGGVVRELLDNACRYSPAGGAIELIARMLDEGVVVGVTDHGDGLDRSIAMKAFEQPFSTGEATLRKEKAGVGVGLHLARQIVWEHGGVMWSDPLPGGGTRVSFCIPINEGQRLAAPPASAAGAA
ncbi:MAG: hybrid sensor histidine kinase/response regulator [Actinomycetota bacterium]|nr:hybrid sensor histidine kinase/response regulator [Actinomycetota bacterium]